MPPSAAAELTTSVGTSRKPQCGHTRCSSGVFIRLPPTRWLPLRRPSVALSCPLWIAQDPTNGPCRGKFTWGRSDPGIAGSYLSREHRLARGPFCRGPVGLSAREIASARTPVDRHGCPPTPTRTSDTSARDRSLEVQSPGLPAWAYRRNRIQGTGKGHCSRSDLRQVVPRWATAYRCTNPRYQGISRVRLSRPREAGWRTARTPCLYPSDGIVSVGKGGRCPNHADAHIVRRSVTPGAEVGWDLAQDGKLPTNTVATR